MTQTSNDLKTQTIDIAARDNSNPAYAQDVTRHAMGQLTPEVHTPPHEFGGQKPSALLHVLLVALLASFFEALWVGLDDFFDLLAEDLLQNLLAVPQIKELRQQVVWFTSQTMNQEQQDSSSRGMNSHSSILKPTHCINKCDWGHSETYHNVH
jgi:hypothetical protein